MIGIDYCGIHQTELQLLEDQLKAFQLFQIISVEETGVPVKELIAFAKSTIKSVDRYDEITDILVKAIRKKRPNISQNEAINMVLDFNL